MKKTLVALAAFAATAAFADATIYGNIDGGLISANNQTGGKVTAFAGAGGMTPTLWGHKGSEDIGGGTKAIYTLEGSFNSGTGSSSTAVNSNDNLFGREANVGLSGAFGTVKLGLQFDPAVVSFLVTDPRGFSQFGSGLQGWVTAGLNAGPATGLGASTAPNSFANIFDSNMVSYSYSANGLTGTVGYAVGGTAGSNSSKSITSLGLIYENGPMAVSYGHFTDTDSTNNNQVSENNVGASYKFGDYKVAANYFDVKPNANAIAGGALETTQAGVGVDYKLNAKTTAYLAYYRLANKATASVAAGNIGKTTLGADYALSKSTGLYAAVTTAKNSGSSLGSVILDQSSVAVAGADGVRVTTWTVGLHKGF